MMNLSLWKEKSRLWPAISASAPQFAATADALLTLAGEIAAMGTSLWKESLRLSRKVSLLVHLLEEIRDFDAKCGGNAASNSRPWLADLSLALEAVKKFLLLSSWKNEGKKSNRDSMIMNLTIQYQYVTWQLEKVLGNISFVHFEISDEVQEEVELVLAQLRREIEKIGVKNLNVFQEIYDLLSSTNLKEFKKKRSFKLGGRQNNAICSVDRELRDMVICLAEVNGKYNYDTTKMTLKLMDRLERTNHVDLSNNVNSGISSSNSGSKTVDLSKNVEIPEDFRCPISLELMRNPVIVSTGQTYECSFIQRWIDSGNFTCPKTQQKLQNLALTPNYVLRSLITQWCEANKIDQPNRLANGLMRSDATFSEINGERSLINALVFRLTSSSRDEQMSAVAELRSLTKRSTNNRKLITEAGAIPTLVSLLLVDDKKIQEHAVTCLLNLSIYDHNKELIVLAGAILPITHVVKHGNMEARENASAAIFSLSSTDENIVAIGVTPGAIESLVEFLDSGSTRGKWDAATALFRLCTYQGNKSIAVRAGIVRPLVKMLEDSSTDGMVDEALIILCLLASDEEGKVAICKANTIPLLIDLLRSGHQWNKEIVTALLLALCHKDSENLAFIWRMGAVVPLTEISKNGSERAKQRATYLLEHLQKLQIV